MDFEKWYSKLPDFIKYNNFILNFFLKIPKFLKKFDRNAKFNSQKQLFELIFLNSKFEVTGTLRNIQLLYLELLRFLDNVCIKYGIEYWIADGTLLGAVRHGGFIPWDDDVDISMMKEDYEKLIKVLPNEISKYPYLKEGCGLSLLKENHENYFTDFKSVYDPLGDGKIVANDKFLFLQFAWLKPYVKIDIFPKDFIRDDKLDFVKKNYRTIKYKFSKDIQHGRKNFDEELKLRNDELGFVKNKTKYFTDSLDSLQLSPLLLFETDRIFPLSRIKFDMYEFSCPNDVFHWLDVVYGSNYMKLPDIIDSHNISPFIVRQFNSKKEMDDKFNEVIGYLKNVNDNFE